MHLNLPCEYGAEDYHEFRYIQDILNKAVSGDSSAKKSAISFREMGFWDGQYWALFYPSSAKLNNSEVLRHFVKKQAGIHSTIQEIVDYFLQDSGLNDEFLTDLPKIVQEESAVDPKFFKKSKQARTTVRAQRPNSF